MLVACQVYDLSPLGMQRRGQVFEGNEHTIMCVSMTKTSRRFPGMSISVSTSEVNHVQCSVHTIYKIQESILKVEF